VRVFSKGLFPRGNAGTNRDEGRAAMAEEAIGNIVLQSSRIHAFPRGNAPETQTKTRMSVLLLRAQKWPPKKTSSTNQGSGRPAGTAPSAAANLASRPGNYRHDKVYRQVVRNLRVEALSVSHRLGARLSRR
jgi:hypothetical protein